MFMRILQLCKKYPFPLKDGEAIAINHLAKALHQLGNELDLLCMNTPKHPADLSRRPEALQFYQQISVVNVDSSIKVFDAFTNLFSEESYHISRFVSDDFASKLKQILQEKNYDIIQLETLYLAPYIPVIRQYSKAKISMRAHNVEHEIWERIEKNTSILPKKWYLGYLSKKLKNFEVRQLHQYDSLIAITEKDLDSFRKLGYNGSAAVIPIGIDQEDYRQNPESYQQDLSISFIGSLDWMPNQEGLQWFLDHIWKDLRKHFPKLSLHIAGRNTPDWIRQLESPNIKIYGEVPCASSFINQHSLMIVPLLSGSGMRAKILEGMALGKVVITTSLGLEGIEATDRKEVLVANQLSEFIDCIEYCYHSNGQLSRIGQNARQFIANHYDNLSIGRNLHQYYQSLLQPERSAVSKVSDE